MELFMILLGCRPEKRLTEQHDIYFGIGNDLKDLVSGMKESWKGSGKLHIDAYRKVTQVGDYSIIIEPKSSHPESLPGEKHLFFINLGGYKEDELEEFHYKVLAVSETIQEATKASKQTAFFRHTGFEKAVAHIDDKYGIDVDDIVNVTDILDKQYTQKFRIRFIQKTGSEDSIHLGYLPLEKI